MSTKSPTMADAAGRYMSTMKENVNISARMLQRLSTKDISVSVTAPPNSDNSIIGFLPNRSASWPPVMDAKMDPIP